MAKWSASGGEIVPAVILAFDVVIFQSIRVAVRCMLLYLVGVVIVVSGGVMVRCQSEEVDVHVSLYVDGCS